MMRIYAAALGCNLALAGMAVPAQAVDYKTLYAFQPQNDGSRPSAGVIDVNGTLFGTTSQGSVAASTVFSLRLKTGVESVVHGFSFFEGASPVATLLNLNGTLYGTAEYGGASTRKKCYLDCGSVFSVDPKTGQVQASYLFTGGKTDGGSPAGEFVAIGDMLYGTTTIGGPGACKKGCGTVFSFNPATGAEKVRYAFKGGADAYNSEAGLIDVSGTLYGTTRYGGGTGCGKTGCGTVFSVDPATGAETVVYAFKGGSDGSYPTVSLTNVGGLLYGTTLEGGSAGFGTIFSVSPASGVETLLHRFQENPDGAGPDATLLDVDGTLYGTTVVGGNSQDAGTVFSFDPATGNETVVYNFQGGGQDGSSPNGSLISVGGTLYGTTYYGGGFSTGVCQYGGCGTVFALKP